MEIGFAIFNACETTLHQSNKPSRIAAEHILKKYLSVDEYGFVLRSRVLSLWLSHQKDYGVRSSQSSEKTSRVSNLQNQVNEYVWIEFSRFVSGCILHNQYLFH